MAQLMTAKFKWLRLVIAATVVTGCRHEDATQSNDPRKAVHQVVETEGSIQGGDSPEAVYHMLVDAVQAEDWRKMCGCVTPETHDAMARFLVTIAGFLMMDEKNHPALEELFKRHGIPITRQADEPDAPRVTAPLSTDVKLSYQTPSSMRRAEDLTEVQAEPRLFATLMLDGKPAVEASRIGLLRVDAARDDQAKPLASLKAKHFDLDVDGDLVDVKAAPFRRTHPRPLKIDLVLERPSTGAESLALLEGSLTLLTGGQTEDVLIRDIRSVKPESAIENEILKAAGVTVWLHPVKRDQVHGSATGPVWSIDMVDGQGEKVDYSGGVVGREFGFKSRAPLPTDVGLRVVVLTGQKPETIRFKFEDVPLPVEGEETPQRKSPFGERSEENVKKALASIKDKAAFVVDSIALINKTQGQQMSYDSGKLTELKIDEDTTTAVRVINRGGKERREPVAFRKIDGRWYVHRPNIRQHPRRRTPPVRPKF
jgi:hypothetical protein